MKNVWLIVIGLIAALVLGGILGHFVIPPPKETSKSPLISQPSDNSSYGKLLRFVERQMTYPGSPFGNNVSVWAGDLPGDLPVKIPLPDNADIIGSLVRSNDYKEVEVVLDVPSKPDDVVGFYRSTMTKAGWNEQKDFSPPEGGGFISAPSMPASATFCQNQNKSLSFAVSAYSPDEASPSDVRLTLDTNPQNSVCGQNLFPQPGAQSPIPALTAPAGALQRGGGSCGGGGSWNINANIETDLSAKDLEAYYEDQLDKAGWKVNDKGSNGPFAWSTWSFTDKSGDNWTGVLFVSELGQKNQRFAIFSISR